MCSLHNKNTQLEVGNSWTDSSPKRTHKWPTRWPTGKKGGVSLVIREMQMKTAGHPFTPQGRLTWKPTANENKKQLCWTWCGITGKPVFSLCEQPLWTTLRQVLEKLKHRISTSLSNSTPKNKPERTENGDSSTFSWANVHSSTTHNSHKVGTTRVPSKE